MFQEFIKVLKGEPKTCYLTFTFTQNFAVPATVLHVGHFNLNNFQSLKLREKRKSTLEVKS
jgi:hypothetical protein